MSGMGDPRAKLASGLWPARALMEGARMRGGTPDEPQVFTTLPHPPRWVLE